MAALVIFDVVDADPVLYMMGNRVRRVWAALEPFVIEERRNGHHKGPMLSFLEDLAVRSSELTDEQVARKLRLRSFARPAPSPSRSTVGGG